MPFDGRKLDSPTGSKIHLYAARPADAPKAAVQINHGMAEHAARYERFADALTAAGYAAVAHDHRGHGRTEAQGALPGIFAKDGGWEKVVADTDAVNRRIAEMNPGTPVVCFGHSMGAIVALNYAMRHPDRIAALAAWNISVETGAMMSVYRGLLKTERFFKGSDVPSAIAPKLIFEAWNKEFAPNRTESDWLSRDAAEVDKYVADPLCGFDPTVGMWLDVTEGVRYAADNGNLAGLPEDLPVYLLAGDKDPASLHGKAMNNIEQRMKAAGMSDVTFTLLEDTRHESLNEVNRDEITARFINWLDERFA